MRKASRRPGFESDAHGIDLGSNAKSRNSDYSECFSPFQGNLAGGR